MKRFPLFLVLLFGGLLLAGANGCSSDPNVEGAKLDLRNKDYDRALENLDKAIESNPQNALAYQLRGQVYQEKAAATNDAQAHATMINQMMEAYEQAITLDPTLETDITNQLKLAYFNEFQKGIQAFNRGRTDELAFNDAVIYFESASVIMPDSAGPYVNQAFALLNANRSVDAIVPFEKAIERGEADVETYTFLANLYLTNDRAADAVVLLEEAVGKFPEDTDLEAQLLNSYQMAGQMDRAMSKYASAVTQDPNNKVYRYNYGSLLLEAERYDEAIDQLKAAVALDASYGNAQYNLGAAFVNRAVFINDRINAIDDNLRENRSSLAAAEVTRLEREMEQLTEERRGLFAQAISPLEQAKTLFEASGDDTTGICQVLFQSYVQTNQTDKAEGVQDCAGYSDMN